MMKALVVVAHGFHLGYLGCYGNDWVATPRLDRLAAEGIVFDQHYADCLAAQPRTSWSGVNRFPNPGMIQWAVYSCPALDNILKQNAIPHALLVEPNRVPSKKTDPLKRCIQQALAELDTLADQSSWLLWLDLPSLCPPWRIPNKFLEAYFVAEAADEENEEREPLTPWLDPPIGPVDTTDDTVWDRLQFTYAAAVSHLDEQVGVLLDGLRQRFPDEDVLICFTGDSGLALGEHGIVGPARPWLHDELIHVPLLLRLPGGVEAGRRIAALTQPVDLLPTLLDALDIPAPPVHGSSLLPLARGQTERIRSYACSGLQVGDAMEWSLRTPEWAFLLPLRPAPGDESRMVQLYVKPDDRWEVNNVVQHHLELAERLERTLRDFVAGTSTGGPFQPPELREV